MKLEVLKFYNVDEWKPTEFSRIYQDVLQNLKTSINSFGADRCEEIIYFVVSTGRKHKIRSIKPISDEEGVKGQDGFTVFPCALMLWSDVVFGVDSVMTHYTPKSNAWDIALEEVAFEITRSILLRKYSNEFRSAALEDEGNIRSKKVDGEGVEKFSLEFDDWVDNIIAPIREQRWAITERFPETFKMPRFDDGPDLAFSLGLSERAFLIRREASMAASMMLRGLDSLYKLDVDDVETFYHCLFYLSIGIERFLKLNCILKFMRENQGSMPDQNYTKDLGHDLLCLYQMTPTKKSRGSSEGRVISFLGIISEFAKTTRYYNLDRLVCDENIVDPTSQFVRWLFYLWIDKADQDVIEEVSSRARKATAGAHRFQGMTVNAEGRFRFSDEHLHLKGAIATVGQHAAGEVVAILRPKFRLMQDSLSNMPNWEGKEQRFIDRILFDFSYLEVPRSRARKRPSWESRFSRCLANIRRQNSYKAP